MVVNILLPFLHARAYLLEDCDLRRRTLDLYRGLPPGHGNEFTQEMKVLLMVSKVSHPVVNSARRQQGLIHRYRVLAGKGQLSWWFVGMKPW